jgi:hypothetical protein
MDTQQRERRRSREAKGRRGRVYLAEGREREVGCTEKRMEGGKENLINRMEGRTENLTKIMERGTEKSNKEKWKEV